MLGDVGKGLLQQPVGGRFQILAKRRQLPACIAQLDLRLDLKAAALAVAIEQSFDRGSQAKLVQRRGP